MVRHYSLAFVKVVDLHTYQLGILTWTRTQSRVRVLG